MKLFKWSEEYSVKSEVLDEQHKKLFDIINALYNAFAANEHKEKLGSILDELQDYTIYHFSEEERLLKKMGAPLTPDHLQAHRDFIDKITTLRDRFNQGSVGITYDLMSFLRQWLSDHIKGVDQEYVKAIRN